VKTAMSVEILPVDIDSLVEHVGNGDLVALPSAVSAEYSGVSMVATRAIIRKKIEGLHLVAVPSTSLQADLLIGAGSVASLLTGSILLYEYGQANRFIAAQKAGSIVVKDSTCPAIHAALIAGEKGLPFMPVRGLIGSDILRHRMADDGWQTIDNPFGEDDPVVVVPPLLPDVTLFHVPLADRFGNVWIGRRAEFATMARASAKTLVTFEAFFDGNLMADEDKAPATIPALYVTAVSHQPKGAWPLHGGDAYGEDAANLREYAEQSKTGTGFAEYLTRYVLDIDDAA
jgi:glutaconate CoA-transferase subunit A